MPPMRFLKFLADLRPVAGDGGASINPSASSVFQWKKRDPILEMQARDLLLPHAADLSTRIVVGWNSRMRTAAGVALPSRHEVWLNPLLEGVSREEVERTLLHELAHLLTAHRHPRRKLSPHGEEWRKACRDLGIAGESRTHSLPFSGRRLRRRFILRCPACGAVHTRVRRPREGVACLSCCRIHNGGNYHERFRFQILMNAHS